MKKLLLMFACIMSTLSVSAENYLLYTSTNGKVVSPLWQDFEAFGANIISNTYEEGQGKILFDGEVTRIGAGAFRFCSRLESMKIAESVVSIDDMAFYQCTSLKSIEIPNSVISIGCSAFCECESLKSVEIPASVKTVGEKAFFKCNSLPVENGIRYAGNYLVEAWDKDSRTYTIKEGTKWIGWGAFYGCSSLSSIVIPNTVLSIEGNAFARCKALTSIVIPDAVTAIGGSAFSDCSQLKSVEMGKSVATIGSYSFYHCESLQNIRFPNSLATIGEWAFAYCSWLKSILFPSSVSEIGDYAFYLCGLSEVISLNPTPPNANRLSFKDATRARLCVPAESFDAYRSANGWCEFMVFYSLTEKEIETLGINSIVSDRRLSEAYNLSGQKVSDVYKGIVVKNGRKFVVK